MEIQHLNQSAALPGNSLTLLTEVFFELTQILKWCRVLIHADWLSGIIIILN